MDELKLFIINWQLNIFVHTRFTGMDSLSAPVHMLYCKDCHRVDFCFVFPFVTFPVACSTIKKQKQKINTTLALVAHESHSSKTGTNRNDS